MRQVFHYQNFGNLFCKEELQTCYIFFLYEADHYQNFEFKKFKVCWHKRILHSLICKCSKFSTYFFYKNFCKTKEKKQQRNIMYGN